MQENQSSEPEEVSKTYFDYYNRVIENDKVGFKLVLGECFCGSLRKIYPIQNYLTTIFSQPHLFPFLTLTKYIPEGKFSAEM